MLTVLILARQGEGDLLETKAFSLWMMMMTKRKKKIVTVFFLFLCHLLVCCILICNFRNRDGIFNQSFIVFFLRNFNLIGPGNSFFNPLHPVWNVFLISLVVDTIMQDAS